MRLASSPLLEPPPLPQLAEDDRVAPVGEHEFEVAPSQRLLRPPAVLDHPLLPDRLDACAPERYRAPAAPGADGRHPRVGEAPRAALDEPLRRGAPGASRLPRPRQGRDAAARAPAARRPRPRSRATPRAPAALRGAGRARAAAAR